MCRHGGVYSSVRVCVREKDRRKIILCLEYVAFNSLLYDEMFWRSQKGLLYHKSLGYDAPSVPAASGTMQRPPKVTTPYGPDFSVRAAGFRPYGYSFERRDE